MKSAFHHARDLGLLALVYSLPASPLGQSARLTVPQTQVPVPVSIRTQIPEQPNLMFVDVQRRGPRVGADFAPAPDEAGNVSASDAALVTTLPPRQWREQPRRFELRPKPDSQPSEGARFRFSPVNEDSLLLWEGADRVMVYNHGMLLAEGAPEDRRRSSYVHPIFGLDGEVLTDDFPKDHYHHRGLFWTWPHVKVGGEEFDLWTIKGIRQRFERFLVQHTASTGATLAVENGWFVEDRKVMRERIWFRVYPANESGRCIDVDCFWIPTDRPVSLAGAAGKSYGGMTLRFAPRTDTRITTTLGSENKDLAMTHLPWADFSARFEGRDAFSGAALFVADDHPDYPPTWLTRHYGALCLGWPGVEAQTFPPSKPIHCRYRVWVHRDAPAKQTVEDAYEAYLVSLGLKLEN